MLSTLGKIQEILADALYLEKADCHADARLINDLGAESIDFLDIVFRLEQEFKIKIPKGDIEAKARGNLSEADFAVEGVITPAGLENLKRAMPEVDPSWIGAGFMQRDIPTLFTVSTFVRIVEEKLNNGSEHGHDVVALNTASRRGASVSVAAQPMPRTGTGSKL